MSDEDDIILSELDDDDLVQQIVFNVHHVIIDHQSRHSGSPCCRSVEPPLGLFHPLAHGRKLSLQLACLF